MWFPFQIHSSSGSIFFSSLSSKLIFFLNDDISKNNLWLFAWWLWLWWWSASCKEGEKTIKKKKILMTPNNRTAIMMMLKCMFRVLFPFEFRLPLPPSLSANHICVNETETEKKQHCFKSLLDMFFIYNEKKTFEILWCEKFFRENKNIFHK